MQMYFHLTPCLVATTYPDEATGDLPPSDSEPDLIASSLMDKTLTIVWEWVWAGAPPTWSDCAGLSPELCSSPILELVN